MVRERLIDRAVDLIVRRAGRRSVEEAWMASLTASDPWLSRSLDIDKLRMFERDITHWVASGAPTMGSVRICLRVREPALADADEGWSIELLVQDVNEPSLIVPALDVWRGRSPFGPHVVDELLTGLGRLTRLAPELATLLDESAPSEIGLSTAALMSFLTARIDTLADAGIAVFLPAWWTHRRRLGLRVKAKSARSSVGSVTAAGVGMDELCRFVSRPRSAIKSHQARMRTLAHAVAAKQALVRSRRMGRVRAGEFAQLRLFLAHPGSDCGRALALGMGLDGIALPDGVEIIASRHRLAGDLLKVRSRDCRAYTNPDGFVVGSAVPRGGTGWLSFLGRLGLARCGRRYGSRQNGTLIATVPRRRCTCDDACLLTTR